MRKQLSDLERRRHELDKQNNLPHHKKYSTRPEREPLCSDPNGCAATFASRRLERLGHWSNVKVGNFRRPRQ
jgi:hypothetical protein